MHVNSDIRKTAREKGVPLWKIADALKISEPTMTRRLRYELPKREKVELFKIIKQLAAEVKV